MRSSTIASSQVFGMTRHKRIDGTLESMAEYVR